MHTSMGSFPSTLAGEETSNEGQAEVRQDHHHDQKEVRGIHGRGESRDAGPRTGDEGGRAKSGRRKRSARQDRRTAGIRSRNGQAAPCGDQSQPASPLAEPLVRHPPSSPHPPKPPPLPNPP